jgi:hypothetical protein
LDFNVDTIGLVSPSLLDKGLKLSNLFLVIIKEGLRVGDLEDDLWLGKGVSEVESGVAAFLQGLFKEGVEFCLEQSIIDVLSQSVLGLVGGHRNNNNIKLNEYSS